MIRVLIADDSELMRTVLYDLLTRDSGIEVVAETGDGRQAVAEVERLRPDLVIMDILMPVMDGLTAVSEIMASYPTPILVLSANLNPEENRHVFQAINRGALDVMEKPAGVGSDSFEKFSAKLIAEVKFLSRIRVVHHFRRRSIAPPAVLESPPVDTGIRDILAIGASTGGPRAVRQLMKTLDPDTGARVLIVQHIAGGFARDFAAWLDRESRFHVRLVRSGDRLEPGLALVAPNGVHLTMLDERIVLTDTPPVNSCRPSVDVLFHSLAEQLAERTVAVLLTGMGKDGAEGMLALRRKGGYTIAQNEASSVIFGMPKAAIDLGGVERILALETLPTELAKLLKR
jgi:two-component system, chemotaxis family, protein-glutamate methylesterase/glutaminase